MYETDSNAALAVQEAPAAPVTETTGFLLPFMVESEFSQEDLAEDTAGMQINFPRVKMPSGGGLVFEVPTADPAKPEIVEKLRGIILYHHPKNAYWPNGLDEDESVPPECSSLDGKLGVGDPGTYCVDCPHNQWGSGKDGIGKACKNGFDLYLLRSGEAMPLLITIPPTSIKPFASFVTSFTSRMRGTYGSIVEIGLSKAKSVGGIAYSMATFNLVEDFRGPELKSVIDYARNIRSQIKDMNALHSSNAMEHQPTNAGSPGTTTLGNNVTQFPGSDLVELPEGEETPF